MSNFFSRLNYSFGNEDWRTEEKALQIKPGNRVLCITASGDRPMHVLLEDPSEVVSVDANPVQNYLFKLKKEALKYLDEDQYLAFMGVSPSEERRETLKKLTPKMDAETADYWNDNKGLITPGIIYQGSMETRWRNLSSLLRLIRQNEINRLYSVKTLEEQQAFLKNEWNHTLWRNAFRYAAGLASRFIIRDPGLYANVDPNFKPGLYLYDRMINCLNRTLARENPLISIILKGSVYPEALPPYLTAGNLQPIKERLDRVAVYTANVITYLEGVPENSFDRFSLSDVASYMDQASFLRLLKAMYRSAKPGARFCMRQFMSRYKIPEGLKPWFQTEPELESQLENEDRAFVYHFTVGKVLK